MKKIIYTLLMILGLNANAQDTNYIGPVDMHDTTWSNFYILDTRRLFLNGQEIFGSTAGVFQILVGGSNFYGDVYFSGGGVSVLNSTTIQFSAGQTVFTSAYSIAYSGATTNSLNTPLGASNTIAVSTGTNGGLAFVTGASIGFATGTPVYVEADPIWTSASTGYYTKIQSDGRFATGSPVYAESDPVFSNANFAGDVTGRWNNITIASYQASGSFSDRPSASGSDSIAIGVGSIASGVESYAGPGEGNKVYSDYCFILSGILNTITNSQPGETIFGGQVNSIISGGGDNFIFGGGPNIINGGSFQGVIAGGGQNVISNGQYGFIGGGFDNSIIGVGNYACFIGGGSLNRVTNQYSSILGGSGNTNHGLNATISGGFENYANGEYSWVGGHHGFATNNSSFVWSDRGASSYGSHGTNTFNFRASGGVWHGEAQLLDGSGNILLARITNAANGVYGNVFTSSNNVYSTATTQAIYSMTINTAGTVSVIGQTNAARTVSLQIVSPGTIQAVGGAIVGGRGGSILDASCLDSAIIGGSANSVASLGGDGAYSFMGGGNANTISGTRNAIIGGDSCDINGTRTTIAGGLNNDMTGNGSYNFIGGGQNNGGSGNNHCGVLSGQNNDINSTDKSAIASGQNNLIENATGLDFIGGGAENRIYGYHSTIIGSYGNFVYSDLSHVIGAYSMATGGLHQIAIGPGSYSRHSGSIVMSGHSDTPSSTNIVSTTTNQLVASFPGGIGLQTNIAPAGGVNIGGTFQLRGVRQPICLGYFTNANPTTIIPVGQGDYYIDAGSNTVVRTFDGTTNGYRFTTWSSF